MALKQNQPRRLNISRNSTSKHMFTLPNYEVVKLNSECDDAFFDSLQDYSNIPGTIIYDSYSANIIYYTNGMVLKEQEPLPKELNDANIDFHFQERELGRKRNLSTLYSSHSLDNFTGTLTPNLAKSFEKIRDLQIKRRASNYEWYAPPTNRDKDYRGMPLFHLKALENTSPYSLPFYDTFYTAMERSKDIPPSFYSYLRETENELFHTRMGVRGTRMKILYHLLEQFYFSYHYKEATNSSEIDYLFNNLFETNMLPYNLHSILESLKNRINMHDPLYDFIGMIAEETFSLDSYVENMQLYLSFRNKYFNFKSGTYLVDSLFEAMQLNRDGSLWEYVKETVSPTYLRLHEQEPLLNVDFIKEVYNSDPIITFNKSPCSHHIDAIVPGFLKVQANYRNSRLDPLVIYQLMVNTKYAKNPSLLLVPKFDSHPFSLKALNWFI